MDQHEKHHQHHVKEREQHKNEEMQHEQRAEKRRKLHPAWYVVVPVILMVIAVLTWILVFWH